jgi:L-ribulokinase
MSEPNLNEHGCVLGLDFGSDSVRTVVVDAVDGAILGTEVSYYPRWAKGLYCDPMANQWRQHPLDYLESMEASILGALAEAGPGAAGRVRGIAVDTTGSTPVLADGQGTPLALTPGFEQNPNAMFILWKDHTSVAEAEQINHVARTWGGADFTRYVGGIYSSEWFWAKALHVIKADPAVAAAAGTVLEHCDWIPALLTGTRGLEGIKRSRCAAGHKAMWHESFGGYPADGFLAQLDPRLVPLKASFGTRTWTSDAPFGKLSPEWAAKLGLSREVVVGVGAFDAHMGAVGGGIGPRQLLKIMGTSTCDVVVVPRTDQPEIVVKGICGQVDGSVIPGMTGYEAGQSAYGDFYAWFRKLLAWPLETILPALAAERGLALDGLTEAILDRIIPELEKGALAVPAEETSLIALDWINGRRTPDANQRLQGAITGLTLGTDAPRIFRALVEATAFGSRAIVERFRREGITIDSAIAIGGVARKSRFVMQTIADVMNMEVTVPAGDQAVALGAAMSAAAACGLQPSLEAAQKAMSSGTEMTYLPDPARADRYDRVYQDYLRLGAFMESRLETLK